MYGLEINQLANLLKETDPNRKDSDSEDEDQVIHEEKNKSLYFLFCLFQPKKNTNAHLTPASFASQAQKTTNVINEANTPTPKSRSNHFENPTSNCSLLRINCC